MLCYSTSNQLSENLLLKPGSVLALHRLYATYRQTVVKSVFEVCFGSRSASAVRVCNIRANLVASAGEAWFGSRSARASTKLTFGEQAEDDAESDLSQSSSNYASLSAADPTMTDDGVADDLIAPNLSTQQEVCSL